MKIERLTDPASPALEQAARVIHDSFEPGYIAQAVSPAGELPGFHPKRYRNTVLHGVRDLETFVATSDGAAQVEAVMVVQPPGTVEPTPNAETDDTRAVYEMATPAVREALKEMYRVETEIQYRTFPNCTEIYWIAFLGTLPGAQGKGLGKALLKSVLDRARAEGRVVGLITQTTDNVSYYERLGFVKHDEARCKLRGTEIVYWSMSWTPPAAAA